MVNNILQYICIIALACGIIYLNDINTKQEYKIEELQDCIVELRKANIIHDEHVNYFLNGGWK